MPAGLYMDKVLVLKEPAWHRIGHVVEEPIPASEAIAKTGVDYPVSTQPLFLPGGRESGYFAVVRDADGDQPEKVFGIAKAYELVHVTDIAAQLDAIQWPLSSVGALHDGATVFFSYDLGDREVVGEQYKMFLGLLHPYTPGSSWKAMLTPIRFVCQNTVVAGMGQATNRISVPHRGDARAQIDLAILRTQAAAMEDRVKAALETMIKVKVTKDVADEILGEVFPWKHRERMVLTVDADAEKRRKDNVERWVKMHKDVTIQLYDRFCDEFPHLGGTGYALYQAVVEQADYRGARNPDRAYADALVGERAKQKERAYGAVLARAN